ncbi:uncharacterized protein LOC120305646 [Crotalus tigris]|uniref:uncharacterized protein LOC120305646 n=1 Tax=Crotalus tigris TaxID=88082 RepID=UPI00192F19BE|nr:uncharacterized protein LOC120305646 [Crotalus tigris]
MKGELPSPLLKVDPLSLKVKEGDPVVFLCSVKRGNAEKIFHFYKDGMEITPREEGLLEPSILWWVNLGAGSQTDSSRSAPRLSSSLPYSFIIKGEEIPLNCSLSEGVTSRSPEGSHKFLFNCTDQSGNLVDFQHIPNNTISVRTENLNSDQIKIICNCKIRQSAGGWSSSPKSNQLVFSVVGELPSPLLKVEPLSQKVKKGDPLVFLCSVEGGNAEKIFYFYKDGMEINPREEGLLEHSSEPTDRVQRASLRILHASINHRGEFTCRYEERRSNRWLMSSWSQGLNITGL